MLTGFLTYDSSNFGVQYGNYLFNIGEDGKHYVIQSDTGYAARIGCAETNLQVGGITTAQFQTDAVANVPGIGGTPALHTIMTGQGTPYFYVAGSWEDPAHAPFEYLHQQMIFVRYKINSAGAAEYHGYAIYRYDDLDSHFFFGPRIASAVINGRIYYVSNMTDNHAIVLSDSVKPCLIDLPLDYNESDLTNDSFSDHCINLNFDWLTISEIMSDPRDLQNKGAVFDAGSAGIGVVICKDSQDYDGPYLKGMLVDNGVCSAETDLAALFGWPFDDTGKHFNGVGSAGGRDQYSISNIIPDASATNWTVIFSRPYANTSQVDKRQFARVKQFSMASIWGDVALVDDTTYQHTDETGFSGSIESVQYYLEDGVLLGAIADTIHLFFGFLTLEEEPVPEPIFLPLDSGRDPSLRQRLVNMYTEPTPKGPTKFTRYQRPGLEEITELGTGPIRASFKWGEYRFTVSGSEVYRDAMLIGSVFGATGQVRFAYSDEQVVIVSGGRAWLVSTSAVTEITDPDLPVNIVDVAFLAGRFIYITSDDTTFYYSALNDATSIDGLNFATAAENTKDVLIRVHVLADQLVFFTTKVIEYWSPTTNIDSPFIRSPGRKTDLGLAARNSVVLMDNALFFVGFDKQVYRTGAVPLKVSNFEVDDFLRRASMDELLIDCFSYTVNFGGHEFYVVHVPNNGTWAYDISMKEWAEWRSWNRGRFRVLCAEDNFLGDFYTGKIMGFNGGRFVDVDGDDEPIERVTNYFHPLASGRLPNTNVVLGCTRGTTERLEDYGSDPVVEMCYSDDEGRNYNGWRATRIGRQGETTDYAKAVWHKCGRITPPGRHYLFRCTDPVRWSPFGVNINLPRP